MTATLSLKRFCFLRNCQLQISPYEKHVILLLKVQRNIPLQNINKIQQNVAV